MTYAWVFAYGSLAHPASAAETLGELPGRSSIRAELRGWSRGFTQARDNRACEKTFALPDGSVPGHVLALNVHPDDAVSVNGVAVAVAEAELERLDGRELRYDRVEVTAAIAATEPLAGPVFAYVAKAAHLALDPPAGAVIIRDYLAAVEAAFSALGPGELERFRRSVEPHPVPVVDARLIRDEIPPGNPRDW